MKADEGAVYFLHAEQCGKIKIGFTTKLRARILALKAESPTPLHLLASAPGHYWDERKIHSKFIQSHSHGEWFDITPELVSLIEQVGMSGNLADDCRGSGALEPTAIKTDHSYRRSDEWRASASAARRATIENSKRPHLENGGAN